MATNFFLTHDDGTLNEYDATVTAAGGSTSASVASAMDGTPFGMEATVTGLGDRAFSYLDFSAFTGDSYQISFFFNKLTFSGGSGDITILRLRKSPFGAGSGMLLIELNVSGNIVVRIRDDGGTLRSTSSIALGAGSKFIEMTVTKASSAVANDGQLEVKIDNVVKDTLTTLDLFNAFADPVRVEIGYDDPDVGTSGTSYWDEVRGGDPKATPGILRTPGAYIADQGGGAAGGAGGSIGGSGSGGGMADISADGLNIYLAAFDSQGFPTIIKILAALTTDGSVVFNPGAGGRIAIQTGELNADYVFAFGQFDGTNTVERSDDAGATFDVIDDGTFGTIRAFQVGPGDDDRILVFDGDNGDIIESLDGGETWTTINASVTQLINSIARFDVSPEESVFGNQGDVTDSINYSPNSGANLEDYQTGVYPNADATKVIAN